MNPPSTLNIPTLLIFPQLPFPPDFLIASYSIFSFPFFGRSPPERGWPWATVGARGLTGVGVSLPRVETLASFGINENAKWFHAGRSGNVRFPSCSKRVLLEFRILCLAKKKVVLVWGFLLWILELNVAKTVPDIF